MAAMEVGDDPGIDLRPFRLERLTEAGAPAWSRSGRGAGFGACGAGYAGGVSETPREDPGHSRETIDAPQEVVPWKPAATAPASPAAIAYRAVLLAALLVVIAFFIRQLLTLGLLMVLTVTIALALSAATTRLERVGVPRVIGASGVLAATVGGVVGAVVRAA
jgi:hypothetical protein